MKWLIHGVVLLVQLPMVAFVCRDLQDESSGYLTHINARKAAN
jgi:hypothetical protein